MILSEDEANDGKGMRIETLLTDDVHDKPEQPHYHATTLGHWL